MASSLFFNGPERRKNPEIINCKISIYKYLMQDNDIIKTTETYDKIPYNFFIIYNPGIFNYLNTFKSKFKLQYDPDSVITEISCQIHTLDHKMIELEGNILRIHFKDQNIKIAKHKKNSSLFNFYNTDATFEYEISDKIIKKLERFIVKLAK